MTKPCMKGGAHHEKMFKSLAVVCAGGDVGPVFRWRRSRPEGWEVANMDGFANLVSMLDYVVDSKRKRHITGGLLISAALLFGGLAITVMSIRDEEEESYG